jgi:hypothetical protein
MFPLNLAKIPKFQFFLLSFCRVLTRKINKKDIFAEKSIQTMYPPILLEILIKDTLHHELPTGVKMTPKKRITDMS